MILGLGIDLCSIERMKSFCSSEAFRRRVFTPEELEYSGDGKNSMAHMAAAFAAKEAFAKATGLGLSGTGLRNVSVAHTEGGRPFLRLNPEAEQLKPFLSGSFHLSISHDAGVAAAVVIYEKGD